MCKPVKGKIIQDGNYGNYSAYFYEYKVNGKDLKKEWGKSLCKVLY